MVDRERLARAGFAGYWRWVDAAPDDDDGPWRGLAAAVLADLRAQGFAVVPAADLGVITEAAVNWAGEVEGPDDAYAEGVRAALAKLDGEGG